jgi:hypothetical protein
MPKVTYTPSKGLVQAAGSGVDLTVASGNVAIRRKVITVSAATKELGAEDSGSVVIVTGGSAATVQLPEVATAAAGWWCTVYAASAQAHIVDTTEDNILQGAVVDGTNSTTVAYAPITDMQKITLANPRIGDRIDIVCDGTSFHTTVISSQTPTLAQS